MAHTATSGGGDLLTSLLRDVSRSFYLTLRALPKPIRAQIGLAYLLARATDTIADTEIVPLPARLEMLQRLRGRIVGESRTPLDFGALAEQQGSPGERALLNRIEEALTVLATFSEADRALVREVLITITSGQELDLRRFEGCSASAKNIVALQRDAELDDYTYRVAGCVGEFWTKICLAHLKAPTSLDRADLIANGVRFGKGLQLVNILRDLPKDLRTGRCYIPGPELAKAGLRPADLAEAASIGAFRPLYDGYLRRAEEHLAAGWEYTNALPLGWVRVRLPCAWPVLIGMRTLARLKIENPLDASHRVKTTRAEVKRLMALSIATYPLPRVWRGLFARAGKAPA